ncbi:MAG TPA: GNAT family N-acetyltransferase [bacterium]
METTIAVEMMSQDPILWHCLYGRSLTIDSVKPDDQDATVPPARFRDRNLSFLNNLIYNYGACAVVARIGERFIGQLRFYPKAVFKLAEPGLGLCLHQEFPNGPADELGYRKFPSQKEIDDKTLVVHCMKLALGAPERESFRRKGIGTQMVRMLIRWASASGWHAIEASAYEDLPIIYSVTGQAGKSFWEKLGFRLFRMDREPSLEEQTDFTQKMRKEAMALGLDPMAVSNKYIMKFNLG